MSLDTLSHVISRIAEAPPESPIAVFRSSTPEKLNAVFAGTVATKRLVEGKHTGLIGVFCSTDDLGDVRKKLSRYVIAA